MRVLTLVLGLVMSLAACAEPAQDKFEAGKHYIVLEHPVRTSDPAKIEVVEAFWYGCSHCRHFEPLIQAWKKQQAEDVNVVLMPAMWNKVMEPHARIFFAADNLGIEDKIRQPVFDFLHNAYKQNNRAALTDIDDIVPFVVKHSGVDADKFTKQFNSFGVTSQVKKAAANARNYKISGTPEMIVDGKYLVKGSMTGGQAGMLEVVDFLVNKIRAEKKG